ncbi:hypothetical protein F0562_024866 [Nyssa sinensis]|uniref:Uncharacterized protein n=1 Tax=Nyssa sinensis TaxID=561372 RepID=A0A5J5BEH0_9ASTE|nr:hypothetical protein F0562_024866 [Nyssa sinensis]
MIVAILTFSNTVEEKAKWIFNKLKGKPLKALPDFLREYNLPPGLFPQNITCYEFDETKAKLIVYLPSPCEACFKDSSVIRKRGPKMLMKCLVMPLKWKNSEIVCKEAN